ncbi:ribosome maturation factor RimM [Persicobacter psychrovividus]|uniref:Ribosome maturation factor RimM n=1 Tax=Persicobacter psychrovividus TaxID=387638 RepID=A0ABN6LB85_9BACT|nr:ribosome maturation factor RimM [Persicobacter psychrovividus]
MRIDQCFELGYITKRHGLQGDVNVVLDVDTPSNYIDLEAVFLEHGGSLVPYIVEDIRMKGDQAIFTFEGVETPEDADALKGIKLFLPLEVLPDLGEGKFYYHEIVGFRMVDVNHGAFGTVKTVYDNDKQPLIAVDANGKEVLVPMDDDILTKVDKEAKVIETQLPDGLLEVYLED